MSPATQELLIFVRSFPVRLTLAFWTVSIVAAVVCVFPFEFWAYVGALAPYPGLRFPTPEIFGRTYLVGLAVSIPIAALLLGAGPGIIDRHVRDEALRATLRAANRWVSLTVATGMAVIPLMYIVIPNVLGGVLLSIPGAAVAVWVIHRVQRHRRIPLQYSLAAFGWGATFAITAGHHFLALIHMGIAGEIASEQTLEDISHGLPPDQPAAVVLSAPVWEEVTKAVGVLVIWHLIRRKFDGVVSGFVLGAMVGVGFNFIETARYAMTSFDTAIFQVYVRQWVSGISFGHVLFTGLTGAALGLASRQSSRAVKTALVATGFGLAVLGHFVWNHAAFNNASPWQGGDAATETLINFPLNYLTLSGPFLLLLAVVVWMGLRQEAAALRATLPVEAATGIGAITPTEATVLANPRLRLAQRILSMRSLGPTAYFRIGRLHAAQLDLAMERWRLAHVANRVPPETEQALRDRVRSLRERLVTPGG